MELPDLPDVPELQPLQRSRSNTWPRLPRPAAPTDGVLQAQEGHGDNGALGAGCSLPLASQPLVEHPATVAILAAPASSPRKRNAWGDSSYADLISQAILSSPEQRMTLADIYRWMVEHVPYFRSSGGEGSSSSVGWKNSIRHNLSLLDRFMRVHNEEKGKSSWWMINPDAKPGGRARGAARRRAATMETSKLTGERRGRVLKRVQALRKAKEDGPADAPPSMSSSLLHGLPGGGDFRPRSSSTASSYASSYGRLSPIPAEEPEWSPYHPAELLAGNLGHYMTLESCTLEGSEGGQQYQPPPQPPLPEPAPCQHHYVYSGQPPCRGQFGLHQQPSQHLAPCQPQHHTPCQPQPQVPCQPQHLAHCQPQHLAPCQPQHHPHQPACPTSNQNMYYRSSSFDDLDVDNSLYCNVDEVVKQELILEGSLDFNFSQPLQPGQPGAAYGKLVASGRFLVR